MERGVCLLLLTGINDHPRNPRAPPGRAGDPVWGRRGRRSCGLAGPQGAARERVGRGLDAGRPQVRGPAVTGSSRHDLFSSLPLSCPICKVGSGGWTFNDKGRSAWS